MDSITRTQIPLSSEVEIVPTGQSVTRRRTVTAPTTTTVEHKIVPNHTHTVVHKTVPTHVVKTPPTHVVKTSSGWGWWIFIGIIIFIIIIAFIVWILFRPTEPLTPPSSNSSDIFNTSGSSTGTRTGAIVIGVIIFIIIIALFVGIIYYARKD